MLNCVHVTILLFPTITQHSFKIDAKIMKVAPRKINVKIEFNYTSYKI